MVSGENKIRFEEWLKINFPHLWRKFNSLDFRLKIGVYLAYYDSLGYFVKCDPYLGGGCPVFYPEVLFRNKDWVDTFARTYFDDGEPYYTDDRNEAYREAFKKANDLQNEKQK